MQNILTVIVCAKVTTLPLLSLNCVLCFTVLIRVIHDPGVSGVVVRCTSQQCRPVCIL